MEGIPMAADHPLTSSSDPARDPSIDSPGSLAAVSQLAARSFANVNDAIDATLTLMRRLLGMEVRMVNQVEGDRHTFTRTQTPDDFPPLQGVSTPLNHNF
jgi:hypothetical protein